jgi:hypothetical protein
VRYSCFLSQEATGLQGLRPGLNSAAPDGGEGPNLAKTDASFGADSRQHVLATSPPAAGRWIVLDAYALLAVLNRELGSLPAVCYEPRLAPWISRGPLQSWSAVTPPPRPNGPTKWLT